MKIKSARKSHINEIIIIENCVYERPWSKFQLLSKFLNVKKSINLVGIDKNDQVISYLFGNYQSGCFFLENITVHPEFRRKKVASKMLDYLFGKLSDLNITKIILAIKNENIAARKLFLTHHFEEQNADKNYYTQNDEAVVLTMELLPNG